MLERMLTVRIHLDDCGLENGPLLVVPGIRPGWMAAADHAGQARTATPAEAVAAGADLLVVGRAITTAADPADAARRVAAELDGAPGETG